MRKLFLIAVLLITSLCSYGQFINLPDTNFRNALIPIYPTCFNAAKQLDTNCAKQSVISELFLRDNGIVDVFGIHYFSNVKRLFFERNKISNIRTLPASCETLILDMNPIVNISTDFTTFTNLKTLSIAGDSISVLQNLPPNLTMLKCEGNFLTNLNNLPASLEEMYADNNQIINIANLPSNLKTLNVRSNRIVNIASLPSSLKTLDCSFNSITALPNLPASLIDLNVSNNLITTLGSLPTNLKRLLCGYNMITSIPTLPTNLINLYCNNNSLSSLPILPQFVRYVIASKNHLSTFPNTPNSLTHLLLDSNLLNVLPVLKADWQELNLSNNLITGIVGFASGTSPSFISRINLSNNNITSVNGLPQGLHALDISFNPITSLPLLPNSLSVIDISKTNISQAVFSGSYITRLIGRYNNYSQLALGNGISALDLAFSKFPILHVLPPFLEEIDFSFSNVRQLPNLPPSMQFLKLCKTPLLNCLPLINDQIFSIFIDSTLIKCIPNKPLYTRFWRTDHIDSLEYVSFPNSIYEYYYNPKECNPTTNSNNCQVYPAISSNIYYDYNNNNTKDANEPFATNIGVRLTNFNRTTTNANGAFTIYADTIGTQTVTITTPRFYSAVPNNINVNLTRYDTTVTLPNIALQLTTLKDSLSTKITPINWDARPGFVYPYLVHYKNVGSTTINATASLQYNNALLNYDSSSNSAVTNTGTQLNLALNSFMPGQEASYIAYFRVKPSGSLLGQVLNGYSNITGGTATAIDSTRITIGGSYDPNDKLSTPQLSTTQVSEGQFINYTIRFQNTGTDTAFTVVIADTLNSLLQANTFEFLGSSHACKTTIQDNKLYFEFRNILLPDSNVNLIGSNGFVNFRIKPQSSVVLNTVIPNKGAIYFDYNEPIITNTATTTISNTILPTHLLGFSAALQSNKTVLLYWNTTNELNTQFFVVEQSTNGKDFEPLKTVSAKGSGNNSYYINKVYNNLPTELYYRLKTIDKDGSISYSNIVKIKQANATGWSIVTNPAKGKLLIEVKDKSLQNTQARLVNGLGQVVQTIIVQQGFNTLNLKNLKAGLYYVQTQNGTKQVVVE